MGLLGICGCIYLVNKHLRKLATRQVPCRAPRLKSEAAPGPGDGAHHGTGSEMARGQSARVRGEQPFLRLTPAVPQKTPPLTQSPHPPPLCSFQHPKAFALASQVLAHPLSQPQVALYVTLCEVPYFLFIGTHMLSTVISIMSSFPYFFSPSIRLLETLPVPFTSGVPAPSIAAST